MNEVILAGGGLLGAFLLHLALWRLRVPRRETTTLVAIFAAGLVADVAVGSNYLPSFGWGAGLYVIALYGVCALTYLLLYTAIEADSPTLSLTYFIANGGANGRNAAEIGAFVRKHPFVQARLTQLEKTGFVVRRGAILELSEKATAVLNTGDFYRRLMGRTAWGG